MKVNITSRGRDLTDFLQDYIDKRVSRLEKYVQGGGQVNVVLERDAAGQLVEMNLHALHKIFCAKEQGEHVRECIDKTVSKIEAQLRKHKEKMIERRP